MESVSTHIKNNKVIRVMVLSATLNNGTKLQKEPTRFDRLVQILNSLGLDAFHASAKNYENFLVVLENEKPDIVFSTIHYIADNSNIIFNVHEILDHKQIPYVGSNPSVLELAISKSKLKKLWVLDGVNTPSFYVFKPNYIQTGSFHSLVETLCEYPYIVKPNCEGNSRGIDNTCIVYDKTSLELKISQMLVAWNEVLVEHFLGFDDSRREFTVAMVGNGIQRLIMPAEIIFPSGAKGMIVTNDAKELHQTRAIKVPEGEFYQKLQEFANNAFKVAGVTDYARCDIICKEGVFYAIEINAQAMLPDLWFETCAQASGLDENAYVAFIILAAVDRLKKTTDLNLNLSSKLISALPDRLKSTFEITSVNLKGSV